MAAKVDTKRLLELLRVYGELVVFDLKESLLRHKKSGGKLDKSLRARVYEYGIEFLADPHWIFVEEGRKPNSKMPPVEPLRLWIKDATNLPEKAAYGVAKNIARFGIKPTHFFSSTMKKSQPKVKAEIRKTMKALIEEQVKAGLR